MNKSELGKLGGEFCSRRFYLWTTINSCIANSIQLWRSRVHITCTEENRGREREGIWERNREREIERGESERERVLGNIHLLWRQEWYLLLQSCNPGGIISLYVHLSEISSALANWSIHCWPMPLCQDNLLDLIWTAMVRLLQSNTQCCYQWRTPLKCTMWPLQCFKKLPVQMWRPLKEWNYCIWHNVSSDFLIGFPQKKSRPGEIFESRGFSMSYPYLSVMVSSFEHMHTYRTDTRNYRTPGRYTEPQWFDHIKLKEILFVFHLVLAYFTKWLANIIQYCSVKSIYQSITENANENLIRYILSDYTECEVNMNLNCGALQGPFYKDHWW